MSHSQPIHSVGRRSFLRVGSLGLLGVGLEGYLHARRLAAEAGKDPEESATASSCVMIWLHGGPSQMDTWDPKPISAFQAIPTSVPGIQISELLPTVAQRMEQVSLVRSVQTEETNHQRADYYGLTGHRPTPAMTFPGLGAIVTKEKGARSRLPPHIVVPGGTDHQQHQRGAFLGTSFDPLVVSDPNAKDFAVSDLSLPPQLTREHLDDRRTFLNVVEAQFRRKVKLAEYANMDELTRRAMSMLLAPEVKNAFDLAKESDATRDAYRRTSFGQSLLLSRRLVEAGARFITVSGHDLSDWDSHADNDKRQKKQSTGLDQPLATFIEDLGQRGLLDSTLVIVMGEFGRTPHYNTKLGRDHWPHCWSLAMAGGGVQGGRVVGASDERGAYVAEKRVTIGDLFATVYKAFGIDWHTEYMSPVGRPIKIANSIDDETGEPIAELF